MRSSAPLLLFVKCLCLLMALLQPERTQTELFLHLLLIKRVRLAKHRVHFIVKQPQVTRCVCHLDYYNCKLVLVLVNKI